MKDANHIKTLNSTEQGNLLENFMKTFFSRIVVFKPSIKSNSRTFIGQIDISLTPVSESVFSVFNTPKTQPTGIIGECKNYIKGEKSDNRVGKTEIEKICWRACKTGFLCFYIGSEYTLDAKQEIGYFNAEKSGICMRHKSSLIVPLTVSLIESVVENNINLAYLLKWSINASQNFTIDNYI